MRKSIWINILLALVGLLLISTLIYQLPPVHDRLSWRVDFALTYVRGLVDPIGAPPTPLSEPQIEVARLPTATATSLPVPTLTLTVEFTPTPIPSPTPLPQSAVLPAPKWEQQDINNCGPASLTMYLRYYGWEGVQTDIADVLKPLREDRNVNVEELIYYVRTHAGWLNAEYRVGGDLERIKQFLAAGIPVMIEESFYFEEPFWVNDDLWAAHYALITGYEDDAQMFTIQDSFRGADQKVFYKTTDEYWQAFNRVYILIYTPVQEATVQAILGSDWDPDANRQHALEAAQAETQSDPKNAFAWFNLGSNLSYFERYVEATDAYDHALELGLPQRMMRYQFGPFIAYFHTGQLDELFTLTEYALKVTPNSEEALLWHGWGLYRQGNAKEALANFQQALEENPNYQDAQYAVDFVRANP
jgi:hypothetical protein